MLDSNLKVKRRDKERSLEMCSETHTVSARVDQAQSMNLQQRDFGFDWMKAQHVLEPEPSPVMSL
jgi:hypothetical protein